MVKNKFKSKPKTPFKKFDNGILINGNCIEGMKSIKKNSIDLVVAKVMKEISEGDRAWEKVAEPLEDGNWQYGDYGIKLITA